MGVNFDRSTPLTVAATEDLQTRRFSKLLPTNNVAGSGLYAALLESALALSRFSYGLLYVCNDSETRTLWLTSVKARGETVGKASTGELRPEPSDEYAHAIWSALAGRTAQVMPVSGLRSAMPVPYAFHTALGHRIVWYVPLLRHGLQAGVVILARRSGGAPAQHVQESVGAIFDFSLRGDDQFLSQPTPDRSRTGARRLHGLKEWARASQALHDSIADLAGVGEAQPFLSAMLADALRVAGTGNGAVALLESGGGLELAHHIVMLEHGQDVAGAVKRQHHFERVPLEGPLASLAARLRAVERGLTSSPDDPTFYNDGARAYLHSLGVRSIHSVALRSGSRMLGWLGAGFPEDAPVSAERIDLICLLAAQMSIAVELARMAAQARDDIDARERARVSMAKLQDLSIANAVLRGAIDELARGSSLDALLGHTLHSICEHLTDIRCDGMLWLKSDMNGMVQMHLVLENERLVSPGESSRFGPMGLAPWEEEWLVGQAEPDQPGILIPAQLTEPFRQHLDSQGIDRLLSFPMVIGGQLNGAFVIALKVRSPMPGSEGLQLAQALTQQGAMATQMTRLAEAARHTVMVRERELAALEKVKELAGANRSLRRSLDLPLDDFDVDRTLGHVLRVISEHIECASSTLCLRAPGEIAFRSAFGYDGVNGLTFVEAESADVLIAEPASELWRIVVEEGRAYLFDPAFPTEGNQLLRDWCSANRVQALLALPLVERGHATGCFLFRFAHAASFSTEQLELLRTLGHHATLVVQMGRLHDRAQARSEREATIAERARIARDFHDTLAQGLTGIQLHLRAALGSSDSEKARTYVESALTVARTSSVDVRRSLQALRALVLENADFRAALTHVLKATFTGSAVEIEVEIELAETGKSLPDTMTTELLRIAQEAATNTLKHARATRFSASLRAHSGRISLVLADNGVGFQADSVADGFGLIGMKERAERIGALLQLSSPPGGGTTIMVEANVHTSEQRQSPK